MIISLTNTGNRFSQSRRIKFSVKYLLLPAKSIFLLFALLVSSCREQENLHIAGEESKPAYTNPISILLDTMPKPVVTDLRNAPPVHFMPIPVKAGGFYETDMDGKKGKIELKPPVISRQIIPSADFTNFGTEHGLALSSINHGIADKTGRLWFASFGGGISMYDGKTFANYNIVHGLVSDFVRCVLEDSKGNIWAGTGAGVSCYDGKRFLSFTRKDGLANEYVTSMVEDNQGSIWLGTLSGGLSRYNPHAKANRFSTFDTSSGLPINNVNDIAKDRNGNLWLATFGGGVCRFDPSESFGTVTTFSTELGLASNFVISVMEDAEGYLWFGTYEGGVSRLDPDAVEHGFTTFTTAHGLAGNSVTSIRQDSTGNIWFGTLTGGVSMYDGRKFTSFSTEQGLSNNTVNSITIDKNGLPWFGTDGGGLSRYNGSGFRSFLEKQKFPAGPVVSAIQDSPGSLWFAFFGNGVCRYDGETVTHFTINQGLGHNVIKCLMEDDQGNLWFGTMGAGVKCYKTIRGKAGFFTYSTRQGLGSDMIESMAKDKEGNLWFGTTDGGISRFDGNAFTTFTRKQGLAENGVICILEDRDGKLWFGTTGGGISRLDKQNGSFRFTNFTTEQGLANNYVMSILEDMSGNLWFGTDGGGVSRWDGKEFLNFSVNQGLDGHNVSSMAEDNRGVIWIGTNKGLNGLSFRVTDVENNIATEKGAGMLKVDNQQLRSYAPVWDIYTNRNGYPVKGLQSILVADRPLSQADNSVTGIIWSSSKDHTVIRFDPEAIGKSREPVSVFIQSVRIDETPLNWYGLGGMKSDSTIIAQQETMVFGKSLITAFRDSLYGKFEGIRFDSITPFYQVPQNLILPYRHNRVNIEFGAVETSRNFLVRFRYILEGYDEEWSPVTDKTSASYGNISEGYYTFKLKAMSPEGIWSEPIAYSFKVLPPWYRAWWAFLSYFLLFFFSLYSIFQWRTRSLKLEKLKLEKKVSQRTSELEHKSTELQQSLMNLKATQNQLRASLKT